MNTIDFFRKLRKSITGLAIFAVTASTFASAQADEGMWLFNNLPLGILKEKYNFEPDQEWADRLMKSCVRFNVGGSASFVSSNGLVLTNHHVGEDTLYKLSTEENNYAKDGFLAKTLADELKAPDLELNQLIKITDVTDKVTAAVTSEMSVSDAATARRAAIADIESKATEESGLRSDVVTLYGGGKYHLYQYKKYTDVRLVWAPEAAIAFFGGDADNFEYPRFNLDACIFRVYEDDKPAKTEYFLKWSENGPAENELTFVAGNPGSTSRINTMAALRFERDHVLPYTLDFVRRREILLQQFSLRGKEAARIAHDQLFGYQNGRKVRVGMLQGLQDPDVMATKAKGEADLMAAINADPEMKDYASAFKQIEEVQERRKARLGQTVSFNTRVFRIAQQLVQMAAEDQKPSNERLERYQDAGRASLEQQLFSTAPIYPELEEVILGDLIALMLENRGADDELCKKVLAGKNPIDRARELISGTKVFDPEQRRAIAAGGIEAINNSQDTMIQFAKLVDDQVRADRKVSDELGEIEQQAYAKISDAIFKTRGTSAYPDATFTMRLAFGPVMGYEEDGKQVPPFTTFDGTFAHELEHEGQKDFSLPERWKLNRNKVPGSTRMNFVATSDIIGGNSGSPVVNKDLELVGLIFDGNIQSCPCDYFYSEKQARSVSVHSSAIREAIRYIYDAESLADQLGK